MEKLITGIWDGQPIWRQKLPSDYLEEILSEDHTQDQRDLEKRSDLEDLAKDEYYNR